MCCENKKLVSKHKISWQNLLGKTKIFSDVIYEFNSVWKCSPLWLKKLFCIFCSRLKIQLMSRKYLIIKLISMIQKICVLKGFQIWSHIVEKEIPPSLVLGFVTTQTSLTESITYLVLDFYWWSCISSLQYLCCIDRYLCMRKFREIWG